ncbi:MAG: MBL fold metallo-hydrolase [Lysobacterales bacterium]
MASTLEIEAFLHQDSGTWSYLLFDPDQRRAAVIDPVLDFDPDCGRTSTSSVALILQRIRQGGLVLDWLLETHVHADHLSAAHWLRGQCPGARIGIGRGVTSVQRTFRDLFHLGDTFAVDGSQFDHCWDDGEVFALGGHSVTVLATPGHTSDSVSYLAGDAVFVGDTLFLPDSGTARCDFPGGSAEQLYASIQRLFALSEATRVLVCHDYGGAGRGPAFQSTIGEQRQGNCHVGGGRSLAEYVALRRARDATLKVPKLILPATQVNIRAGALPEPEANGLRYLKLPLDAL